jgi:MSHA biogenesis protein MshO
VPAADQLSFDVAETCFKSIGTVSNAAAILAGTDFLVLNNYGATTVPSVDFPGQNAYEAGAANRVLITGRIVEAARVRISFAATTFQRVLHESPGKRFYVTSGPITYQCNTATGKLTRHVGYAIAAAQPTAFAAGDLIADQVAGCGFSYLPNGVAPQVGLLTITLTLSRALSGGQTETVSLYHAVHVSNVP